MKATLAITAAIIGVVVALGVSISAWLNANTLLGGFEREDPHFSGHYPPLQRLQEGMSRAEVAQILGPATRTSVRADAIRLTEERVQAFEMRKQALYAKMVRLQERPYSPQRARREREIEAEQERISQYLKRRDRETWQYDVRGWHGSIEIIFDVEGRVISVNYGYA